MKSIQHLPAIVGMLSFALPTMGLADGQSSQVSKSSVVTPAQQAYQRAKSNGFPLNFEPGETKNSFVARTSGYNLQFTSKAVKFIPHDGIKTLKESSRHAVAPKRTALDMQVIGAENAQMHSVGSVSGRFNYLIGSDKSKWRIGVPAYQRVETSDIYKGIDLIYYGSDSRLEYDFNVKPLADPNAIKLGFDVAHTLKIDRTGALLLNSAGEEIRWEKPIAYQMVNGQRKHIACSYAVSSAHQVAFKVGTYDHNRTLVIDPTLAYCSYLGTSGVDTPGGIVLDHSGNLIIAGQTNEPGMPVKFAMDAAMNGARTVSYLAKMNLSAYGNASLVFCTYVGGSTDRFGYPSDGWASDVTVDSSNNIYITGSTSSNNFPFLNGYQSTINYDPAVRNIVDCFLTKLTPDGSIILYSTLYGGTNEDDATGIAVDSDQTAYIVGNTSSRDIITTPGCFKSTCFGVGTIQEAFLLKFNTLASGAPSLVYASYVGNPGSPFPGQYARRVRIDSARNMYIAGQDIIANLPIVNAFQPAFGGYGSSNWGDGFLVKLDPTGSRLLYSTYIGGSGNDQAFDLAVSEPGIATIVGITDSFDFPVKNAYQPALNAPYAGLFDAFVTRIDTTAAGPASLVFSTYLGGTGDELAYSVCVDSSGYIYVAGRSWSLDFPQTADHIHFINGGYAHFVTKFSPDGSSLVFSTLFGWPDYRNFCDLGYVTVNSLGDIFLVGSLIWQEKIDPFAPITANAYQQTFAGYTATTVTKIAAITTDIALTQKVSPPNIVSGGTETFTLAVTNHGPAVATGTVATANITSSVDPDAPFSFTVSPGTASEGSISVSGHTVAFNVGTLAPGATVTATFTVATSGNGDGTITSAANVTCDEADTNPTNNSATNTVSVLRRTPVITSISPATVASGGPAFTLTVNGTNFASGAFVVANRTILVTTYVSPTQVTAAVPASLISSVGTANVYLQNPSPGTISNPAVLLIGAPALRASVTTFADYLGRIYCAVTITNGGNAPAANVQITRAVIGSAVPITYMPISLGTLGVGSSTTAYIIFPRSAGASGAHTSLTVNATYTGGTFSSTIRITLP